MKLLKDLDAFIIPPGFEASISFKNLDEKYYLNKDEEIQKALDNLQKGEYESVVD